MVTEKTFGAIAGLLVEGGSALGSRLGEERARPGRDGPKIYNSRGQCGTFGVETRESRHKRAQKGEAHQSSDKMAVRGRDGDNQINVIGRRPSLSDILYSFSRKRPPAASTNSHPRCPSTILDRLSLQPAFFSTAHPTLSRWSLPFSRSFHALVTPPRSRSRPSSRCHKRRLLGYHLRR